MDKIYNQNEVEEKWYQFWEESGFFKPEVNPDGKPFTIILPPPNANADLHFGHACMSVEDILIRYHRMKGEAALWLPGSDHAGIETQFVYEKHLAAEGKSRFDFSREQLYKDIWDFVQKNKGKMETQLRRLGFSVDWSREKFTLDPDIIEIVYATFKRLFDEDLVYRANRLVNYCTFHDTSFSDLEVVYVERTDPLYYVRYPLVTDNNQFVVVATTRPEPIIVDTHLAVNPNDPKNKHLIGKKVLNPLSNAEMEIIGDSYVDPEFGTGVVKITPAHDVNDFEVAQKHDLPMIQVIGYDGKMNDKAGRFAGLYAKQARRAVVEELEHKGLIEKIDENYLHRIGTCYKCGNPIEPLPLEQWYVKTKPLAEKAIKAVKDGELKIFPDQYEKIYLHWLDNIRDWNISRQPVWGIRIPAWKCSDCNAWNITTGEAPTTCDKCSSQNLKQDTDTFDTWFSSGQWPFATLKTTKPGDFEKFYPTSVMETGRDILFYWVARMVMLGIYATGKIPFENVVIHGLVLDPLGKKMSKSKGNVVSPMEVIDQYGADAARMALVYGTATGNDQALSYPKLQAMRNFTNKLWNIGRFIIEFAPEDAKHLAPNQQVIHPSGDSNETMKQLTGADKEILNKLSETAQKVTQALDQFRFHDGADVLYEFIWHEFADVYIESTKERRAEAQPILEYVFRTSLELLHPYMPFLTEELWQKLPHEGKSIMVTSWPASH